MKIMINNGQPIFAWNFPLPETFAINIASYNFKITITRLFKMPKDTVMRLEIDGVEHNEEKEITINAETSIMVITSTKIQTYTITPEHNYEFRYHSELEARGMLIESLLRQHKITIEQILNNDFEYRIVFTDFNMLVAMDNNDAFFEEVIGIAADVNNSNNNQNPSDTIFKSFIKLIASRINLNLAKLIFDRHLSLLQWWKLTPEQYDILNNIAIVELINQGKLLLNNDLSLSVSPNIHSLNLYPEDQNIGHWLNAAGINAICEALIHPTCLVTEVITEAFHNNIIGNAILTRIKTTPNTLTDGNDLIALVTNYPTIADGLICHVFSTERAFERLVTTDEALKALATKLPKYNDILGQNSVQAAIEKRDERKSKNYIQRIAKILAIVSSKPQTPENHQLIQVDEILIKIASYCGDISIPNAYKIAEVAFFQSQVTSIPTKEKEDLETAPPITKPFTQQPG